MKKRKSEDARSPEFFQPAPILIQESVEIDCETDNWENLKKNLQKFWNKEESSDLTKHITKIDCCIIKSSEGIIYKSYAVMALTFNEDDFELLKKYHEQLAIKNSQNTNDEKSVDYIGINQKTQDAYFMSLNPTLCSIIIQSMDNQELENQNSCAAEISSLGI